MANSLPGVALCDVRGPLTELLERLSEKDASIWLYHLKKFLRKENSWHDPDLPLTRIVVVKLKGVFYANMYTPGQLVSLFGDDCQVVCTVNGHLNFRTEFHEEFCREGRRMVTELKQKLSQLGISQDSVSSLSGFSEMFSVKK